MEPTYNTRAIILDRLDFRENDSRIVCYSEDKGKLELVARGAKKLKSKSSGHIEPLTLSRLMVVAGKEINYVGTATGEIFFPAIKNNLEKLAIAGQALKLVNDLTREGEAGDGREVFDLLKNFLEELEKSPLFSEESLPLRRGGLGGVLGGGSEGLVGGGSEGAELDFKSFFDRLISLLGFSEVDALEILNKHKTSYC